MHCTCSNRSKLTAVTKTIDAIHWSDLANCQGKPGELFFPAKGKNHTEGKKVCLVCKVRKECLEYALTHKIEYGIWGGLSSVDRDQIIKMRSS